MRVVASVIVLVLAALLLSGCGTASSSFVDPGVETTTSLPEGQTTTSMLEPETTTSTIEAGPPSTVLPPDGVTQSGFVPRLQAEHRVVFSAKWSEPQRPAAFWVTADETLYLLDAAKRRLLRVGQDGKAGSPIPINMEYPLDVAVAADGVVLVVGSTPGKDGSGDVGVIQAYGGDGGLIAEHRHSMGESWMQRFVADETTVYCTAVAQQTIDEQKGDYRYITKYPAAYREGELLDPWDGWDAGPYDQPLSGGLGLRVGGHDPGEPVGSERAGEIQVYSTDGLVFSAALPMPDYGVSPVGLVEDTGELLVTSGWMLPEGLSTCLADDVWVYSPAGLLLGKLNVLHPMYDPPDGGVSRSRLTKGALFQLGTTPTGIEVVRYDLTTLAQIPPLPADMPADFTLVAAYGQGWRLGNSIDTATGRCSKDLLDGGVVKTKLRLTSAELKEIYRDLAKMGITQYDSHFVPEAGGLPTDGPYQNYWLELRIGEETAKFVSWADNLGSEAPEALALRSWFAKLWRMIESKPAWKALPPVEPE